MSENTIFLKRYDGSEKGFAINEKEVWRYSGYLGLPNADSELSKLFMQCVEELKGGFSYKVCYRRMAIRWENGMPVLPFASDSKGLAKCLKGSSEVILFAATIGLTIDRLIAKYQRLSATKALLMQAYGAERIECLCDVFCDEMQNRIQEENLRCTPRFSPGYGDLPLEKQIDFFQLLDCNRQIGISLNQSLLMSPSKSVTAIMGLTACPTGKAKHKCEMCNNITCAYRNDNR